MKSKKHLIIIVAITMVAAVVSVQLCGCFSIAEFKKLFEDSGPRGLYSAGVAQDYFKLHTEALDIAAVQGESKRCLCDKRRGQFIQ